MYLAHRNFKKQSNVEVVNEIFYILFCTIWNLCAQHVPSGNYNGQYDETFSLLQEILQGNTGQLDVSEKVFLPGKN